MNQERELYLSPNGQDMWLILNPERKTIKTIDITTKNETVYPFLTTKEAKENYHSWLNNQDLRLPKTFILKATEFTRNFIGVEIQELGLPTPSRRNLKEYVVYHKSQNGYVHINIEDFTNSILPVLDAKWIRTLCYKMSLVQETIPSTKLNEGVFSL